MITIWNRYLLSLFIKCFILSITSFNFLYILIDYSSHPDKFYLNQNFQYSIFFQYYFYELIRHFNTLAPFAILISTIKVISQLVISNELLAMMASGKTIKKLLLPLFIFTGFITLTLFINLEFLTPTAMQTINKINDAHKSEKKHLQEHPMVKQIILKDDSTLLFQRYDTSKKTFYDVYWILSIDEVYHMSSLQFSENATNGAFIDLFKRNHLGEMVKIDSWKSKNFSEMEINKKKLKEIITSAEDRSISMLWKSRPREKHTYTDKEAQILAALYNKIATPWLCLVALIAPLPLCIQFTRRLPIFMIYAMSLFGIVVIMILFNSSHILGKRQVLDPFLVTCIPFIFIMGFFTFRYKRL